MIKKTIILYINQIYKAILPLLFVPLILEVLGTEKYGMLAFYYMLIGLIGLLDAGISGTFLKFIATNKNSFNNYRKVSMLFLKTLFLFLFVAITLQLLFYINSDYIFTTWLTTKIDRNEGIYSIKIIGIILALLYIKSYLVSFLNGMEKQELVALWGILYSSMFYFGGYLTIKYIDNSLYGFFSLMNLVAIFDIIIISIMVLLVYFDHYKRLKRQKKNNSYTDTEKLTFKNMLKFSVQLSGLSIIWVLATQIDKFVLSSYIPLAEYTKYQIAVQLSSIVAIFSGPISQILLPKLSKLYIEKKSQQYINLYCNSMYIFIFILAPIIPYFFFFGNDLIALWIGNTQLGIEINDYAKWLVSSAFIAATMNFVFILLYSMNQLKYHFYAYALYSLFTIPLSIFIAKNYGALASAKFIFIHTLVFMIFWAGWQFKKHFSMLILNISLFFTVTIILSSAIFYFSSLLLNSVQTLALKSFLPPIINILIIGIVFFISKNRIKILKERTILKNHDNLG